MPDMNVGGQAVIEGVMMRSKDRVATAVRKPDGEIVVKTEDYQSLTARRKLLGLPIVRGVVVFAEMLVIGIKTLNFSAEIAVQAMDEQEGKTEEKPADKKSSGAGNSLYLWATVAFGLLIGLALFLALPLFLAGLFGIQKDALPFNLIAGAIRLLIFLVYVWAISQFGEFRRVFEYHGAEHKSIYAYEMGDDLVPERAACHTRFHPRCGTSFILIVALFAIMVYSVSDTIYALIVGHAPAYWTRLGVHFCLLPLVAGVSYELLKLSGRTRDNFITRMLIKPGLWLQKITTKEPSMDQLEVAIVALEASLGITDSKIQARKSAVS